MLITGGEGLYVGQSVEIYHPDRKSACKIHYLPGSRAKHTQDGSLVCGGKGPNTFRSCERWNADTGAWDLVTESLTDHRHYHSSWTPVDGSVTYLMGGGVSCRTCIPGIIEKNIGVTSSEIIDKNNGVTSSFPLRHKT